MSIHKLTAGSGYDYLTRQVAALDATEKGHTGLADYYTEKGERPGVWVGRGMAGIDGLEVGDTVTADHMQNLFGAGHHPLATKRLKVLDLRVGRPDQTSPLKQDYQDAARLGVPFKTYSDDVSPFRVEVARRFDGLNRAAGLPGDWPVPAEDRARIRTEVGREFFRAEYGRDPVDARELAAVIAKNSRPKTTAVAGYDLTFSPVKSVSVLWAVADRSTAAAIEKAHQAAVADAVRWIEDNALFTRQGANGVRQVDVKGMVATAFTHRDSRAGDPDLHTHLAVSNKVQAADGKWRAIDGRVLFKAVVSASETYNTALERHLTKALGVRFEAREGLDPRKPPVREIVGVDPALTVRFSKRRASVEQRRDELASAFQTTHGRPPTPIETLQLAQQATLETREAKHEPRSLAEQRTAWHTEALVVLGSQKSLTSMVASALHPSPSPASARPAPGPEWVAEAAGRVIKTLQSKRSSWQYWHVYAAAQQQVRSTATDGAQAATLVDELVDHVLSERSVSLARPAEMPDADPVDPEALRRASGASVYTVAGSELFTSATVLDAERRLVDAASRRDGFAVTDADVGVALLESTANGVTLNPGQTNLVTQMATSGARLQLAIAPAGSGKTTAMHALAAAWTEGGGDVVGLAPSAAAADALRHQISTHDSTGAAAQTDTLAKLVHSLTEADEGVAVPGWVEDIGPSTLLVIDEAGLADTLSLDAAVAYALERGASVRLVGDDQQLAAIGAGGVLRDIQASHGAQHLSELVRFTDPAEGAASLALREGRPEALGFYLDRDRVHAGDRSAMTDDLFGGWQADRARGLDTVMLAPTRDLVADLNQRARTHRLEGAESGETGPVRQLADGNDASTGDLVITRTNKRSLRVSPTDWVKNGDRWTVLEVHDGGDLSVQHAQHGRTIRLPADYVADSVDLGYACTVHGAQGVTADTMHGLATGSESRQQLYTMLTRGRSGNHLYLETVGDGDPHLVVHPDLVHPPTAVDILKGILARDQAPRSATTMLAEQSDPAVRLAEAAPRYLDSLALAAEHVLGSEAVVALDEAAGSGAGAVAPRLADDAAWPALRAHLLLLGAQGSDPVQALHDASRGHELHTARDRAAVLDWRLDDGRDGRGHRSAGAGPLPWMPGIPAKVAADPEWGDYLTARADLVTSLAEEVRSQTLEAAGDGIRPAWASDVSTPDPTLVSDVEVWRAATGVAAEDRRPTGPGQPQKATALHQRRLNRRLAGDHTPAVTEWSHLLRTVAPQIGADEFTATLAERLAATSRAGLPAADLLRTAAQSRPLPDDHAAAALWWRMAHHLTPAVATSLTHSPADTLNVGWKAELVDLLGQTRAEKIQASSWWPALVANVDHGLARGWQLAALLYPHGHATAPGDDVDECQDLVLRTSIALDPIPGDDTGDATDRSFDPDQEPPEDLWEGVDPPEPPEDEVSSDTPSWRWADNAEPPLEDEPDAHIGHSADTRTRPSPPATRVPVNPAAALNAAADAREERPPMEPSETMLRRAYEWERDAADIPSTRTRLLEVNALARNFFETQLPGSWGHGHLTERFGFDLAGHPDFRPGHAPAGWTMLVDHLRDRGVTDEEMLAVGLATRARTGRLIDRFRDRVVFPIHRPGTDTAEVLGFVGRRHPDLADDQAGAFTPKYLNTADTPLFHKGAQLFGAVDDALAQGAVPVVVEGPMDAIAVTVASAGRYIGLAPLGTSLTEEQAIQLAGLPQTPMVATDPDLAGQMAAERDYWMLTPHNLDPTYARLPAAYDPADLLAVRGPAALVAALDRRTSLGGHLLDERLANLPVDQAGPAAASVLAARPGYSWPDGADQIADRTRTDPVQVRRDLHQAVTFWDTDPRRAAAAQMADSSQVRTRLEAAATTPPEQRWGPIVDTVDPRLSGQPDWPATAQLLQQAHDQGHDVDAAVRAVVADRPLGDRPAQALRYRLVTRLDVSLEDSNTPGEPRPRPDNPRPARGPGFQRGPERDFGRR